MKDEQVERILDELKNTRQSFESAIKMIKWNRINTFIQYALLLVVIVMIILGAKYYVDDKHDACVIRNDLRSSVSSSLESNAAAIGIALTIVTDAPQQKFQQYMDAYNQQDQPSVLKITEC